MAEAIGLASSLLALAVFAFKASVSLHEAIESFRSSNSKIRALKTELEDLCAVLKPLSEDVDSENIGLETLKLPLLRCGHACDEFGEILSKCSEHSGLPRTSFRDWVRVKYMRSDIDGFRGMLAGYKATINIAVGGATLRRVVVTADTLVKYKSLIADTTAELEEHLRKISAQLQSLQTQDTRGSTEHTQMREERESTRQCLDICAQVSERLEEVRPLLVEQRRVGNDTHDIDVYTPHAANPSKIFTAQLVSGLQERTRIATLDLKSKLQRLDMMLNGATSAGASPDTTAEWGRFVEELGSIERGIDICKTASGQASKARINLFEDVTAGDDANQVIVSTLGDLISAKRVTVGSRSTQWLGQMTDDTLQSLSKDRLSERDKWNRN